MVFGIFPSKLALEHLSVIVLWDACDKKTINQPKVKKNKGKEIIWIHDAMKRKLRRLGSAFEQIIRGCFEHKGWILEIIVV